MFLNLSGWWSARGRRRRACAMAPAFVVALLSAATPGLAQAQGVVTGVVTDDTRGVLPGAGGAGEHSARRRGRGGHEGGPPPS
ncbi:MAG: hypothetical protein OXG35_33130 [Acidobacteria bacterium]|nr:hypothetical protein [Acidobacteriota bacterium]